MAIKSKNCIICKKRFFKAQNNAESTWKKRKYCSISCCHKGKNSYAWKGEKVGYFALHTWVQKWKGVPLKCEMCGTEKAKKYEWANIDHKYHRVLDDFIRMCTRCHRRYDRDIIRTNHKELF